MVTINYLLLSCTLPWDSNCSTASLKASSGSISNSSIFSLTAASKVSCVILRVAIFTLRSQSGCSAVGKWERPVGFNWASCGVLTLTKYNYGELGGVLWLPCVSRRILQSFRHDINIANYPFTINFPSIISTPVGQLQWITTFSLRTWLILSLWRQSQKKRKGVNCAYLCKRIANFLKKWVHLLNILDRNIHCTKTVPLTARKNGF